MERKLVFIISIYYALSFNVFSQTNIKVGEKAPLLNITDWVLNVSEDKKLENKFIVLEFWATWCAPCLNAVPHLNELQNKFGNNNVYFISITDEPVHKIIKASSLVNFKTIVVSDQTKITQRNFGDGVKGISRLPLTVLMDNKGIIKWIGTPGKLTETTLRDFLNDKLVSNVSEINDEDLKITPNKNAAGFQKLLSLAVDKKTKFYIEIEKSEFHHDNNEKGGTKLFYLEPVNVSNILTNIFGYNINQIAVDKNFDKQKYSIFFKNDSLSKEEGMKLLRDIVFSKLRIGKKESSKKITAKEFIAGNKHLLEKSSDDESSITEIKDKTVYSKITLKNLAKELNKHSAHYFVFLSEDEEVYNFFIDTNSPEKIISDLKQYGITLADKEIEIKLFEFYQKN